LIGLIFNNTAFAEKSEYYKRCRVEYTQLDLITGTETIYKDTSQFLVVDHCEEGLKRLPEKLYKWLDEKDTNVIVRINEFRCQIGNVGRFTNWEWSLESTWFSYDWGKYRTCETYIQKLSEYLVDKYPNKIGANIYQESIAD
jgi:hypothetical protein